jgi:hypothetical protein
MKEPVLKSERRSIEGLIQTVRGVVRSHFGIPEFVVCVFHALLTVSTPGIFPAKNIRWFAHLIRIAM